MKQGLFITLEGIDGAGKSTHAQALAEALQAAGHALVRTREPARRWPSACAAWRSSKGKKWTA